MHNLHPGDPEQGEDGRIKVSNMRCVSTLRSEAPVHHDDLSSRVARSGLAHYGDSRIADTTCSKIQRERRLYSDMSPSSFGRGLLLRRQGNDHGKPSQWIQWLNLHRCRDAWHVFKRLRHAKHQHAHPLLSLGLIIALNRQGSRRGSSTCAGSAIQGRDELQPPSKTMRRGHAKR